MGRKLSVFSFEGLIFNYPVKKKEKQKWLEDPSCLSYPEVPDLPGKNAWDSFACSFLKKADKESRHDVMVFTDIATKSEEISKRLAFLLKTIGIEDTKVFQKEDAETSIKFYRKNIGYSLSCAKGTKNRYEEVNFYLNDFDFASKLADYVLENFRITAVIHDIDSQGGKDDEESR